MSPMPGVGSHFAGYRIDRLLGRGGMAEVYLAQHLRLGRFVALKVMSRELADDDRMVERFVREPRLAASIDHPHIIPVYEADEADGVLYIAMRYVPGGDLNQLIREQGRLDPQRVVSIIGQVGSALDAAHAHGLTHRDVKPANILLFGQIGPDATDHAYLSDFGLTKEQAAGGALTATGQFVGTIDYTAPEQIEGGDIDGHTDIYALGCVLYQCLTGSVPFSRDSEVSTMFAHLLDPPPRITERRVDLPGELDDVVATALAKRKEDRFPTCAAMTSAARAALRSSIAQGPAPSQRHHVAEGPSRQPLRVAPPRPAAAPPNAPAGPVPPRAPMREPTWRLGQPRPDPREPGR